MPKRTNEESPSNQPAAKRTSNVAADPHQELLLKAQASLDRLDFKTTEEICSGIIDSGKDDVVQPLMMRSISLGRRGQYCESVQDAEKALESKKSLETHLRAAFSYLGLVQHHLDLAKELSHQATEDQNDPHPTQSLLSTNVNELEESIQEARSLEKRGSFKRVSPELFTKIVAFCDSPSLAMVSGTCKSWKDLISNDTELFRSFTMRGKARNIVDGLWSHGVQCKHSIHSVNLEVTNKCSEDEKESFEFLSYSKKTLRSVEISHQGDLGPELWTLAQKCKLSVLSSTLAPPESAMYQHSASYLQDRVAVEVDPDWDAQLIKFVWTCNSASLICDDALLSNLRQAKVVELGTRSMVNHGWVINLLSSSGPSLVKVKLPSVVTESELEVTIPNLHLPELESLFLGRVPLKDDDADEESFFERLKAPKLLEFGLGHLDILGTLSGLKCKQITSLEIGLEPESDYDGQMVAYTLVSVIKTWGNLQKIHLQLEGRESSNFCNHFSALITPLSSTAIDYGFKDRLVFPNLKRIAFSRRRGGAGGAGGGGGTHKLWASANILACLVASRKAVARRVSPENVLWAASNQYQACQEPPAQGNVKFSSSEPQVCSVIESVDISQTDMDYESGTRRFDNALKWLEENLKEFKHPYYLQQ